MHFNGNTISYFTLEYDKKVCISNNLFIFISKKSLISSEKVIICKKSRPTGTLYSGAPGDATCHVPDFTVVSSFQVIIYNAPIDRSRWRNLSQLWLQGCQMHFHSKRYFFSRIQTCTQRLQCSVVYRVFSRWRHLSYFSLQHLISGKQCLLHSHSPSLLVHVFAH